MRTIAIANQKGGCGKTTTAVNLSAALAEAGQRVLLIDLDPQGHATLGFGFDPESMNRTIYNAIAGSGSTPAQAPVHIIHTIVSTGVRNLSLIPSNILLSGGELELARVRDREYVLRDALESVADGYDLCLIDCSPSLSLLAINALVASTDVIVPVQAHYYALEGLRQLLETVNIVGDRYNSDLAALSILLTFIEPKTSLSRQVEKQMRGYFGHLVFNSVIHRNIRLAEAPSAGQPIILYASNSKGADDYRALAREIIYGDAPAETETQKEQDSEPRNTASCAQTPQLTAPC